MRDLTRVIARRRHGALLTTAATRRNVRIHQEAGLRDGLGSRRITELQLTQRLTLVVLRWQRAREIYIGEGPVYDTLCIANGPSR